MQEFLNAIYPWVISALGGVVGAVLILPTKLGEALVQYRVGRNLEAFKAQHAGELENIKAQLAHLGDRGKRSNEMEFQAIEKLWRAFVKAWLSTNTCLGQMFRVPMFAGMTDEELQSFAMGSGLNEEDGKALLSAADKQKKYVSIVSWHAVNAAGRDVYEARLTLREQRIFMPPTITQEFSDAIEQMSGAQVERRLSLEHPEIRSYEFGEAQTKWMSDCKTVFEHLATTANARLFRDERR
jgi:hypothetical protein